MEKRRINKPSLLACSCPDDITLSSACTHANTLITGIMTCVRNSVRLCIPVLAPYSFPTQE